MFPVILTAVFSGLAVGSLSGLVGIGGGIVLVPLLLYVFKLNVHLAAGTSLAILIPTAITGSIVHISKGNIDWRLAGLIAVGSVAGSMLGAWIGPQLSSEALKKIFAVILVLVSLKVAADAFQWRLPVNQASTNKVITTASIQQDNQ